MLLTVKFSARKFDSALLCGKCY